VEVPPVSREDLECATPSECSAEVAARVAAARARQLQRQGHANARLAGARVLQQSRLEVPARVLLGSAMQRLSLSARAYHRVLRVARTIADLAQCDTVRRDHVAEAVSFRNLDRRVVGTPISA
jgi:magnesium chelatase family protein